MQCSAFVHLTRYAYAPLQSLGLSGCNITGALPTELSNLANLRHLDVSNNPGLVGTLPSLLAGLSFLQTLDVSGCSLSGTLPTAFAALQQLKEFRAANNSISGTLPGTWGLLQNLQVSVLGGFVLNTTGCSARDQAHELEE